jgi:hypothetical protein
MVHVTHYCKIWVSILVTDLTAKWSPNQESCLKAIAYSVLGTHFRMSSAFGTPTTFDTSLQYQCNGKSPHCPAQSFSWCQCPHQLRGHMLPLQVYVLEDMGQMLFSFYEVFSKEPATCHLTRVSGWGNKESLARRTSQMVLDTQLCIIHPTDCPESAHSVRSLPNCPKPSSSYTIPATCPVYQETKLALHWQNLPSKK